MATAKEITQETVKRLEAQLDFPRTWKLFVHLSKQDLLSQQMARRYSKAINWLANYLGCRQDFLLDQVWEVDTAEADVRNIWEESKEFYKETE